MAVIEYNSNTALDVVKITSWSQDAILAADNESVESTRHIVKGEGIIAAATVGAFSTLKRDFRRQWHEQGGPLVIDLGTDNVISIAEGDNFRGPHVKYSFVDLTHVSSIVNFEITFDLFEFSTEGGVTLSAVASHTWTQRFVVDESGLSTYFVVGKLRTIQQPVNDTDETGSNGGWAGNPSNTDVGANPDRYRQIILPELPVGFRVRRMEFVVDESQTRLAYSIEMFQAVRSLPAPAKRGSGSFRWRKSLNSKNGMLGLKIVEIELEAGKNASPADLLRAAYEVSQTMITYTGDSADLVQDVEVEQPELFEKNIITLRIVALGNARPASDADGPLVPLNVDLVKLGETIEGMTPYKPPGPYAKNDNLPDGDLGEIIYRIQQKALWVPDSTADLRIASLEQVATPVIQRIYVIPGALYDDLNVDASNPLGSSDPTEDHQKHAYLDVEVREWVEVVDTGMRVLRPRALNATDIPFQIDKPIVLIHSEATIMRRGMNPERAMLAVPPGGVVRKEEFKVRPGPIDAANNRTYIAQHTRVVEIADPGGNQNEAGFRNQAHSVGGGLLGGSELYTFRTWWPPHLLLAFPHDPTIELPVVARGRHLFQSSNTGKPPFIEKDFIIHAELPNHYVNGAGA